ncbi:Heat shock 70 kDa protein 12A [Linnemannia elongata]|nr:Heat shock 70 kDa protein 12A [Linnemannia elongata]
MEQNNPQDELLQAVRPVHKNNLFPTILAPVAHVVITIDPIGGRKVILWDDILQAFKDASHPRHGTKSIPFLKGPDLKCLDPLRFNAVPDAILDIVVDGKFISTDPPLVQATLEKIANRASQYTAHNPYDMIHSTPPPRHSRSPSSDYLYDTPNYQRMPTPVFWNQYTQPASHQTRTPSPLPPYPSSSVRPPTFSRPLISSSRLAPPSKLKDRKNVIEAFRKFILRIDLVTLEEKGEGTPEEFAKALECYLKAPNRSTAAPEAILDNVQGTSVKPENVSPMKEARMEPQEELEEEEKRAKTQFERLGALPGKKSEEAPEDVFVETKEMLRENPIDATSQEQAYREQFSHTLDDAYVELLPVDPDQADGDMFGFGPHPMYGGKPSDPQIDTSNFEQTLANAEYGDIEAQVRLGLMYMRTSSGEHCENAVRWFSKAVLQGDAKSQGHMDDMFLNGLGVPRDYKAAIQKNLEAFSQLSTPPMQSQSFNPRNYPIVVAIEFGNHVFKASHSNSLSLHPTPKQSIQHPKTPTLTLYKKDDPEHKLVAWGWRAKVEALRPSARHHTLLSRYKLHLNENQQSSPLDVDISVLEAISHYLDAFHEYVVGEIMRGFAKNFQRDHFRYCLTVPAPRTSCDHPDRLMLLSEPEAAALYCERKCDQFNPGNGDRFMICDVGDETVELTVFEIAVTTAGRGLAEVTKSHSASCSSVFLDRHMRRLLEKKFGPEARNFPANIIPNLVDTFADVIKSQFDGLEDQYFLLPANRCFEDLEDPKAVGIDDGYLVLTAAELKENVFEPVIEDVLSLIQEQLTQAKDCGAIFLVGGFGSSTYLSTRVNAQFSSQVGLISIPPLPELAVVRGAVYAILYPRVATSRIARRCYGISSDQPFEKGKDPLAKRKFELNKVWCIDRFSPYIKRGQKVNVDECISREFSFTKYSEALKDYRIALYATDTDKEPPRYTTDAGVFKLAEIPIPCPHLPSSHLGSLVKVKVNMKFGLNEIKAEAVVGDKVYSAIIRFDAVNKY